MIKDNVNRRIKTGNLASDRFRFVSGRHQHRQLYQLCSNMTRLGAENGFDITGIEERGTRIEKTAETAYYSPRRGRIDCLGREIGICR